MFDLAEINAIAASDIQPLPHEFVEDANFVTSRKGTALLVDSDGQAYSMIRKSGTRSFWRCVQHKKMTCPGRAVTASKFIVKKSGLHTHESDLAERISNFTMTMTT